MSQRRGFTLIELMVVVVVIGILAAVVVPNYICMKDRERKEARVVEMAHIVQLAAEDFAVSNDGIYSDSWYDLAPFLPGGIMLPNPFTDERSEPHFGSSAKAPGEVGIQLTMDGGELGYIITGYGSSEYAGPKDDGIIVVLKR